MQPSWLIFLTLKLIAYSVSSMFSFISNPVSLEKTVLVSTRKKILGKMELYHSWYDGLRELPDAIRLTHLAYLHELFQYFSFDFSSYPVVTLNVHQTVKSQILPFSASQQERK